MKYLLNFAGDLLWYCSPFWKPENKLVPQVALCPLKSHYGRAQCISYQILLTQAKMVEICVGGVRRSCMELENLWC